MKFAHKWLCGLLALAMVLSLFGTMAPVSRAADPEARITAQDGMVDDVHPAFTYIGQWDTQAHDGRYAKTYRGAHPGASCEIRFEGRGIHFLSAKHAGAGAYKVSVDGLYIGDSTLYADDVYQQAEAYALWGLEDGLHTLRLDFIGWGEVDAAQVFTEAPSASPAITLSRAPVNAEVTLDTPARFSLSAEAAGASLRYQWQQQTAQGWTSIPEATAADYETAPVQEAQDGEIYRCLIIAATPDGASVLTTDPVQIVISGEKTKASLPRIISEPLDVNIGENFGASFSVEAQSPDHGTITYQWQVNTGDLWEDVAQATEAVLFVKSLPIAMDGARYRCRITNTLGELEPTSVYSREAILHVIALGDQKVSLDPETGLLDVDYASYLSQHDVVYREPMMDGSNGSTVGTGRLGAMVWNNGGYKLELTNVDAAPYSSIPSGLVTYTSTPMPQAVAGSFEQRLSLHKGTLTTNYGDGLEFTVMGEPKGEVMGIHVVDNRENVSNVSVDLSLWLDRLNTYPNAPFGGRPYGNPSINIPEPESWLNPIYTCRDQFVAITRGYTDPNNFGHTMALTVDGANFQTQLVGAGNDKKLRLSIDPTAKEYTIWIVNPARRSAENHDTLAAAEKSVQSLAGTYEDVYARFLAFWDQFWKRCFVQYQTPNNAEADYFENSWYLYQYLFACGSYGEFPYHFMNGVWRGNEQDEGMWSWDYTNFNERTFSYTHFATNRLEQTDSYYNLFINNLEAGKRYVNSRFWENDHDQRFNPEREGFIPGSAMTPERHTWDGELQVGYNGTEKGCPYTTSLNASACENALGMYERYKYSGDRTYLEEKAYPVMRSVGIYLLNFLQLDPETNTYYSDKSNALEQYWKVKNPINDLASFPALLEKLIEAANLLEVDQDLVPMWQDRIDRLAPPKTEKASEAASALSGGELRYQPHDPPRDPQRNSQNPELDVVFPYNRVGLYQEGLNGFDFATALNSYYDRKMPINIWTPEPIVAARLGLGDESFQYAINMIARSQTRPNGIHYDGNGSMESNALMVTALNEELLQSYNDKIVVFPAVMSDPDFRSKFTLLARNGFLVSSEYEAKTVKYISLVSQVGADALVINPWGQGTAVTVTNLADSSQVCTTSDLEIRFPTEAGGKYLIEAEIRPVSSMAGHETMTGIPNDGSKILDRNGRTLGTGSAAVVPDKIVPITEADGKTDDTSPAFVWSGSWGSEQVGPGEGGSDRFERSWHWSNIPGSSVDIHFEGTGIEFYSTTRADGSVFRYYVDNVYMGEGTTVGKVKADARVMAVLGLPEGTHVLTVRKVGVGFLEADAVRVISQDDSIISSLTLTTPDDVTTITEKGGTLAFTAQVTPEGLPLTWSVTDLDGNPTDAAVLDDAGVLTARKNGVVLVSVSAEDLTVKTVSKVITISGQSESGLTIRSVEDCAPVFTVVGTAFNALTLPGEVAVTMDNGATAQFPVKWIEESYNSAVPGTYTIRGHILSGNACENPKGLTAAVKVTVSTATLLPDTISTVAPVELQVTAGTAFEDLPLPGTLKATLQNGTEVTVSVTWDPACYEKDREGVQTVNGAIAPSSEFKNVNNVYATAKLIVRAGNAPDLQPLTEAIAAAKALKEGILVSSKTPDQVEKGVRYVIPQQDQDFSEAIAAAERALTTAKTQEDVTGAVQALNDAAKVYESSILTGLFDAALEEARAAALSKLAEAEKLKKITVLDAEPEDVDLGEEFVSEADYTKFCDTLDAIRGAIQSADSQEALAKALAPLDKAVAQFQAAIQVGTYVENPFTDVPDDSWFAVPVMWAVEHGITAGLTPTRFGPDKSCTRAQAVTFLWRMAGEPEPESKENPFTDLNEKEYYMDAILWAVENGITAGVSADRFAPGKSCTRAQIVTFLWRFSGKPGHKTSENPFTDLNPNEYYMDAILWAVENKITSGVGHDSFAPTHTCTRAQIVTFLYRTDSLIVE